MHADRNHSNQYDQASGNCAMCADAGMLTGKSRKVLVSKPGRVRWAREHPSHQLHRPRIRHTGICANPAVAPYPSLPPSESTDGEEPSLAASIATNVLAGLTTSLSMVPEALAFSLVAGLSPVAGIQTAAVMSIVAAVFGSQPGCMSGAAGATAVVLAPLTAAMGKEYLYAAVVLAGFLQVRPHFCRACMSRGQCPCEFGDSGFLCLFSWLVPRRSGTRQQKRVTTRECQKVQPLASLSKWHRGCERDTARALCAYPGVRLGTHHTSAGARECHAPWQVPSTSLAHAASNVCRWAQALRGSASSSGSCRSR